MGVLQSNTLKDLPDGDALSSCPRSGIPRTQKLIPPPPRRTKSVQRFTFLSRRVGRTISLCIHCANANTSAKKKKGREITLCDPGSFSFSSVQSLDRLGRLRDKRDDPTEILFQSFLQEAPVRGSGMGRNLRSLMLSIQRFPCRPRRRPPYIQGALKDGFWRGCRGV